MVVAHTAETRGRGRRGSRKRGDGKRREDGDLGGGPSPSPIAATCGAGGGGEDGGAVRSAIGVDSLEEDGSLGADVALVAGRAVAGNVL